MPYCGGSHFNTTPPPFFSSFSTELTFKLWHQLPCQTRCDFPLLHLPRLPTGVVSPLAAFPSLLPAHSFSILSASLRVSFTKSQHPRRPCCRWALLALLPVCRLALGPCSQENCLCLGSTPASPALPANLHTSPSLLLPHPALSAPPSAPASPLPKASYRDVPPLLNVHLHLAQGLNDIFFAMTVEYSRH